MLITVLEILFVAIVSFAVVITVAAFYILVTVSVIFFIEKKYVIRLKCWYDSVLINSLDI